MHPIAVALVLGLGGAAEAASPEGVLLQALTRPFTPGRSASAACRRDAAEYLEALRNYAPWALQMYDASAKVPPGVVTGNYRQLGNYDECLRVRTESGLAGQACSATVQFAVPRTDAAPAAPAAPATARDARDLLENVALAAGASDLLERTGTSVAYEWTWCVPASCNATEVAESVDAALDPLRVPGRVDLRVRLSRDSCRTAVTDAASWSPADWAYASVLLVFCVVVVGSTAYDLAARDDREGKGPRHSLVTAFSVYSNGKRLLRTERPDDSIACLDGIRFLGMCWIVLGHTYYVEAMDAKLDLVAVPKMHENWANLPILNGNVATDAFFLLGGTLLARGALSRKRRHPEDKLDIRGLYAHRYVRLTPAYAMTIGLYATLFDKIGSGPRWRRWVGTERDNCRDNWWANLLYVNNYVNVDSICLSQSWYLAVDMQLLWISPVFLWPMLERGRRALFYSILGAGIFASALAPFLVTYFHGLTGTMLYYKDQLEVARVYLLVYTRVYARAGPYVIGLGLGYLLHRTRPVGGQSVRMSPVWVWVGWIASVSAGLSAVLGPRGMYFADHPYDSLEASFYAGLHRQAFALSVSWIVFACVHGHAGPVGSFLSWTGWSPLGRLTYSVYLTHYVVILYGAGVARTAGVLSTFNVVHRFFGNLALSLILSVGTYLFFEVPFVVLGDAFGRRKPDTRIPGPGSCDLGCGGSVNRGFSADENSPSARRKDESVVADGATQPVDLEAVSIAPETRVA
ncbi:O-acyltransferase like protein [Orussus abietinus]|uniref:O-acyltransferase like protein n=1 Tax=Orussus abietinus TaxID=222816 RepID=UPI000626E909|nr:O-acyltransferase like protein [Orussus abietinus]